MGKVVARVFRFRNFHHFRFFFLSVFVAVSAFASASNKLDIRVCSDCEYKTISAAIAAVSQHGKITVEDGLYKEHDLKIQKSLELIAHGNAVVDGENAGTHVFHILSSDVKIKGFTIKNTGLSYIQELSGIRVTLSGKCELTENHFDNTTYGIYLENSRDCILRDNTFRGRAESEAGGGNGIHLWQGENVLTWITERASSN